MEFVVTLEEKRLLIEVLRERQRELLREISRADHHPFRKQLQDSEKLLEGVLNRLEAPEPVHA